MSELEPFENQSKVTQVELIYVLDKYDPYIYMGVKALC